MEIYPAIDLFEGKVVRLQKGDFKKITVYSMNPAEIARKWADEGARWLHVVDLEGARSGRVQNWEALERILIEKRVSVQFGGGVRRREDIERLLEKGVQRVILGTKALDNKFLEEITRAFPKKIALSFDLRGEEVQVEGWLASGKKSVYELFKSITGLQLNTLVVTDIEKDGTLTGVNVPKFKKILMKAPFPVILSGGISQTTDLVSLLELKSSKLNGVIIGKAIYEGWVKLKEAVEITKKIC